MNKTILEKLIDILGITYYLFSLVASAIVLIQVLAYFNLKNGFIDFLVYIFCFGGSLAMQYITLRNSERYDKENK